MKLEETWLGFGVKPGGHLFLAGIDSINGMVWNLRNPQRIYHQYSLINVRLGPGLGGGADLVIALAFNTKSMYEHQNKNMNGWGFNVRHSAFKLKDYGMIKKMDKVLEVLRVAQYMGGKDLSKMSDAMEYIYNAFEMTTSKGPQIFFIDAPIGAGYEISVFYTIGTLKVFG